MPKFRKKPVIIEAEPIEERIEIQTLEGVMTGEPGDWLITGVNGERYPCKPDIFVKTYEPVSALDKEIEDKFRKMLKKVEEADV